MNTRLISQLLKDLKARPDPPGCELLYFDHPCLKRTALSVAIVHEHRFAFHYWLKWGLPLAAEGRPPDLVTIDRHDDIGGECDFDPAVLRRLDVTDPNEVAMFCWAGLRQLNDGHVAPATFLAALGDVHAVVPQGWSPGQRESERVQTIVDRRKCTHTVRYHRSPKTLCSYFARNGSAHKCILDIDLDFFTRDHESRALDHQIRLPDRAVRRTLAASEPLMSHLWPTVLGITIALEPRHCGGWRNAMRNLNIVLDTLFPQVRRGD